ELMRKAGIEVIPGSESSIEDFEEAKKLAGEIGFPVLIKASYGGGGRGMRIARDEEELKKFFEIARNEAKLAFGKAEIYVEKYLLKPRHIEFQILADEHGNVIHLGERECSIQRRYQKLLEETPSPALNEELREKMGEVAIKAARTCNYTNAGTIEFLLEDEKFYFLEVNKRIQVEHLITELVTGIDLVEQQIKIANGEKLGFKQKDVQRKGWAMNCRINCEDPDKDFIPCPGKIRKYKPPEADWIRIDTHLYEGYKIPYHYDSLIAKVSVIGKNRKEAIERMRYALKN
ncbi:MAG TPA: ATP-grasp domain-containing protein, partial [Candidatus Aenigmarchaeota archaeon]|nr:ATP-grasp domain-containing protein [Candidatus Aenigmarchaeota archaeon]